MIETMLIRCRIYTIFVEKKANRCRVNPLFLAWQKASNKNTLGQFECHVISSQTAHCLAALRRNDSSNLHPYRAEGVNN